MESPKASQGEVGTTLISERVQPMRAGMWKAREEASAITVAANLGDWADPTESRRATRSEGENSSKSSTKNQSLRTKTIWTGR